MAPSTVFQLLQSGGWLMLPIALASVAGCAICIERAWALRVARVAPAELVGTILREAGHPPRPPAGYAYFPLGRILVAGVAAAKLGRARMIEAMEGAAASVTHDLERHLTALGAIASATPLLGLLGTVIGMIRVFAALVRDGANPAALAGGIGEALVTTAAGICVAIPALVIHRALLRRVDNLVVRMERDAAYLANALCPEESP